MILIGTDDQGHKELVAIWDDYRECKQSWREVLLELKHRGLALAQQLATGDGALGFWSVLREVFHRRVREQRCWVHKTGYVLNHFPKHMQPQTKQRLHEIWMAES